MNINQVRIGNILLAAVIAVFGKFGLLFYIAGMQLSLEILNKQTLYLQHPCRIYNLIFWAYDLVLIERLRSPKWLLSSDIEWLLNVLEHIAFGMIICLKLYIYAAVFLWRYDAERWKKVIAALIAFNIVGLLNEIFQNWLANRSYFILTNDSTKDLWMNLIGSAVFLVAIIVKMVYVFKVKRS